MLPTDILKLEVKHRWLSETEEFAKGTPTDTIIFKTLTGIGATHGEILLYRHRHSIIIEPNVPVLTGKRDAIDEESGKLMYPDILVVYKGIRQSKVESYLKSDVTPKKILCTPEAYEAKVKPAIENSSFDLYNDFFMLLDECDRLIKDVDFREKIILPIEDFFKFKQKAMISATVIVPSDPRFEENGFRILKIEPQFDYAKPITLISTNNVVGSLQKVIKSEPEQDYFIFVNSTNLTHSIIKLLDIETKSRVFCASTSVTKLSNEEFKDASSRLGNFKQFNFLTSRFFGAVDIKLNGKKPNVIMITDLYQAEFTTLDPYTDSVQIAGRLRNGVNKLYHITNYKSDIKVFHEEAVLKNIHDSFKEYKGIADRKEDATTEGARKTLEQALKGTGISLMIDDNGKLNWFMVDNALLDNKVKGYYRAKKLLEKAYSLVSNFKVKSINWWFDITDAHLHRFQMKENARKRCESVADILDIYARPIGDDGNMRFYLGKDEHVLRAQYPEEAAIYDRIGYAEMKAFQFRMGAMKRYIVKLDKKNELDNPKMKVEIQALYDLSDGVHVIEEKEMKADVQAIFNKYRMRKKFAANDIKRWYDSTRTTGENGKVWKLRGLK